MRLEGQVAAVTGAGQGIGRSIARRLAQEGAAVVVSDISTEAAQQVARDIADSGGRATPLKVDVTIPHEAQRLTTRAIDSYGALDILVNNAGVYPSAPILEITEEEWDFVIAVNLKGVFLCSQPAISHMITQRKGAIVNISSGDAKMRTTGNAHYAAAKAGVISLTRTLACETAPYGIRVNAVAPGWIGTDTLLNASSRWRQAMEHIPVGRLGTPEEVAEAVLFLASDVSSYITGEVLDVNGGLLMD
jgi:3-oxoacyl-[acyl-carrier protein] reductase